MKYFILILSFILSIISPTSTFSDDKLISKLQSGGNIVFIRHALAPGNGDPHNIDLNNCNTQRNLNKTGIEQSKRIGLFLKIIISQLIKFYLVNGAGVRILRNMLLNVLKLLMV